MKKIIFSIIIFLSCTDAIAKLKTNDSTYSYCEDISLQISPACNTLLRATLVPQATFFTGAFELNADILYLIFFYDPLNTSRTTIQKGIFTLNGTSITLKMRGVDIDIGTFIVPSGLDSTFHITDTLLNRASFQLQADNNTVHFDKGNKSTNTKFSLMGKKNTFVILQNTEIHNTSVSMGNKIAAPSNTVVFESNSTIGENVRFFLQGNNTLILHDFSLSNQQEMANPVVSAMGSLHLTLHAAIALPQNLLDLTGVTQNYALELANNFNYIGDIVIPNSIAANATSHAFILNGSSINGSIILPETWTLSIKDSSNFHGSIFQMQGDTKKLIYLSLTEEGSYTEPIDIDGTNVGNAGISANNTHFTESITTTNAHITLVQSTVHDAMTLTNGSAHIIGTTLEGTLVAHSTDTVLKDSVIHSAKFIDTTSLTIINTHFLDALTLTNTMLDNSTKNTTALTMDSSKVYGKLTLNNTAININNTLLHDIEATNASIAISNSTITAQQEFSSTAAQPYVKLHNSTLHLTNTTLAIPISGTEGSRLSLSGVKIHTNTVQADTIDIYNTIQMDTQKEYTFRAKNINILDAPVAFSSINNVLGETLRIHGTLNMHDSNTILFAGDVNFTTQEYDRLILDLANANEDIAPRVYFKLTTPLEANMHGTTLHNIISGTSAKPVLYTDNIGGYDITLEENPNQAGSYDIVVLNPTVSNAVYTQSLQGYMHYSSALWSTMLQKPLEHYRTSALVSKSTYYNALSPPTSPENTQHVAEQPNTILQDASDVTQDEEGSKSLEPTYALWAGTTVFGSSTRLSSTMRAKDFTSSTHIGLSVYNIPVGRANIAVDTYLNYGYTKGTLDQIRSTGNFTNHVLSAGILASFTFPIVENTHALMLTLGQNFDTIFAQTKASKRVDTWQYYSMQSILQFSYIYTDNKYSVTPFIHLRYQYLPSKYYVLNDKTTLLFTNPHTGFLSAGLYFGYTTSIGITPYAVMSYERGVYTDPHLMRVSHSTTDFPKLSNDALRTALGMRYKYAPTSTFSFSLNVEANLYTTFNKTLYPGGELSFSLNF